MNRKMIGLLAAVLAVALGLLAVVAPSTIAARSGGASTSAQTSDTFGTAAGAVSQAGAGYAVAFQGSPTPGYAPTPAVQATPSAPATAAPTREADTWVARLNGFREVPPRLTNGTGMFQATLSGDTLRYQLTFSGLSTPAQAAHIHFGQPGVNGGIVAFLCGGNGTPACPSAGGTVTGTITAANIVAVAGQGVAAGDFAGLGRIIASGDGYVNVHTTQFPDGEIRGQIRHAAVRPARAKK